MPANGRWDLIRRLKVKNICNPLMCTLLITPDKIGVQDKTVLQILYYD